MNAVDGGLGGRRCSRKETEETGKETHGTGSGRYAAYLAGDRRRSIVWRFVPAWSPSQRHVGQFGRFFFAPWRLCVSPSVYLRKCHPTSSEHN